MPGCITLYLYLLQCTSHSMAVADTRAHSLSLALSLCLDLLLFLSCFRHLCHTPLSIPLPPPATACFPLFHCFQCTLKSFTLSPAAQGLGLRIARGHSGTRTNVRSYVYIIYRERGHIEFNRWGSPQLYGRHFGPAGGPALRTNVKPAHLHPGI